MHFPVTVLGLLPKSINKLGYQVALGQKHGALCNASLNARILSLSSTVLLQGKEKGAHRSLYVQDLFCSLSNCSYLWEDTQQLFATTLHCSLEQEMKNTLCGAH